MPQDYPLQEETSLELTAKAASKKWWVVFLLAALVFGIGQILFGGILVMLLGLLMPASDAETFGSLFSFVGVLLLMLLINKSYNKRSLASLGFHRQQWTKKYALGLVFGAFMIACIVGLASLSGVVHWKLNHNINWFLIFALLIGFIIQGMTEEVIARGYLQNAIATKQSMNFALLIQAIFFTAIHAANPGITFMAVVNLFLIALMFGLLFNRTDSMWFVGALHSAWNFLLGPVIGIEVSGNVLPSTIFQASAQGSSLVTGGNFGIEGSIFTTAFALVMIIVLYRKKAKQ